MLPAELAWPEWNGKPQSFLAQLDLGEIHAVLPSCLPAFGVLYFFYDQQQEVFGFDPGDAGGWSVLYYAGDRALLEERAAPLGLGADASFACKPVIARRIELLPDAERLPKTEFDRRRDGSAYTELREAAFEGITHHQMLGFPSPVQDDEMELQCQLASQGVDLGKTGTSHDPRRAALAPGATEWKLLLQLDSDDDTGWMWGDVGTLYFWIREKDATLGDFSKVWMIFQCC